MFTLAPFPCTTEYKGIKLDGIVTHCSVPDVWLDITSPYKGITSGGHMPYFGLISESHWNIDRNNNLTEKGKETITHALIEAYEAADFLYKNREMLYERIKEYEKDLPASTDEMNKAKNSLRDEKRKLKALFKQGKISQAEYTSPLKFIKESIQAAEYKEMNCKKAIFKGFAGLNLRFGDEDQYIKFVKKYFSPEDSGLL